jgi:hypothetical protein
MLESPEEKRKRQFDYMMSDVLKERQMHLLAGVHYSAWGNFVFVISATATLIQALLATLAQANLYSERAQSFFNISIALLASISVFWQSFVKHWDYSGKAALHVSASSALEKIYNLALMRAREETANLYGGTTDGGVRDELKSPAENNAEGSGEVEEGVNTTTSTKSNANDEEDQDKLSKESSNVFETLTKQLEQAIEHGKEVPMKIACAFQILDTRVGICKKEIVSSSDMSGEDGCRVRWEKVFPALYQTLTTTIISQPGWPFFLPNPEKIVDKAMRKFQNFDAKLLESLLERNKKIEGHYRAFESTSRKVDDGAYESAARKVDDGTFESAAWDFNDGAGESTPLIGTGVTLT